jgi:hypothetical protein
MYTVPGTNLPEKQHPTAGAEEERAIQGRSWTTGQEIVTRTRLGSPNHMDILKNKVGATALSTEDIIIRTIRHGCHSADNILKQDILHGDAIGRTSRRAAIEVILLDVDPINTDIAEHNIGICNVSHVTGRVVVGLDAGAVLGVDHDAVPEENVGDGVIGLPSDGADAETVRADTGHAACGDVVSRGYSHAVVLVDDDAVLDDDVG